MLPCIKKNGLILFHEIDCLLQIYKNAKNLPKILRENHLAINYGV